MRAFGIIVHALAIAATAACSTRAAPGSSASAGKASAATASEVVGPTADRACADLAEALCGRIQTCSPFVLQAVYGGAAGCVQRTTLPCKPQLSARGSQTTPALIESCAKAVAVEGCADMLDNVQPAACRLVGELADGIACATSAQCQSGYCRLPPGAECGTCVNRVTGHSACLADTDCASGLVCNQGTCLTPGLAGAPCGGPVQACARTLACIGGTCKVPGALAAACDAPTDCDGTQGLFCNTSTKRCMQMLFAAANQPCGIVGKNLVTCAGGATCLGGKCVAPAADGAGCDPLAGRSCLANAACAAGKCSVPDPGTCR
jgi:hypothetical protein